MLHKRFTVIKNCCEDLGSENDLIERVDWLSYTPEPDDLIWMNPEATHDRNYQVVEVQQYTASNAGIDSEPLTVDVVVVSPVNEVVPPREAWDLQGEEALHVQMKGNDFYRLSIAGGDNLAPIIGEQLMEYQFAGQWFEADLGDGEQMSIGRASEHSTKYFVDRFDTLISTATQPFYQALYIAWCTEKVPALTA